MDLNEALIEHMTLHHRVTEYTTKPDGSLKADDLGAYEQCGLGRWLVTDGAPHQALPEHSALMDAHAGFHRVSADVVRRADAASLERGALSERGELKASLVGLCLAITRLNFKIG